MHLTKRCKYSFDLLWADMQSWEILEIAARHYSILKCLNEKNSDYNDLFNETAISRSTLGIYIKDMAEAGLVVEEKGGKKGNRKIIVIQEKGKITFEHIKKYELLFLKPTLDDEIQDSINEILDYYENGYEIKEIEQIASKRLINICNNNPEAIFYPSLQKFFEDYLKKQELSMDINCVMQMHIRYIMQNLELKAWFYESLFPILVNQVKSSEIDYRVRNTRVAFLWEIFRLDESMFSPTQF